MLALLRLAMAAAAVAAVSEAAGIGVNWGTLASHRLPSRTVVELLNANGISRVKLFDADAGVLGSFSGTDIELMVGIPNEMLQLIASSTDAAAEWVRLNVTRYAVAANAKSAVNIRYVAVGNEPFLQGYSGQYQASTYPALRNIQQAIVDAGLADRVKVTVPFNADVLSDTVTLPSEGVFRADVAAEVGKVVKLLAENGSPFTMNIYPFLDMVQDANFPQDFAFFEGTKHSVVDGKVTYTNVFDASHDLLVSALARLGYPNLPIIVGEIGWPTDGHPRANPSDAQTFIQGLVRHVTSATGTPLRPGAPIQTYVFGLFDEDLKSTLPGNFERHWGIFGYDGQAKYSLDLGTGRSLVSASKVKYLPSRWCILATSITSTKDVSVATKLGDNVNFACSHADCTSLVFGSSCSGLGVDGNASYAFNSYYQLNDQVDGSCYFDGLATVTMERPSAGSCKFGVQIDTRSNGSRATGTPRAVVASTSGGASYSTSARTCMSMLVLPLLHVGVVVLPLLVLPDLLAR